MEDYLNINGVKIRYKEINKGVGRPLVMFNGTALNYEAWKPLSKLINNHMIMIDLPGVGGSGIYSSPPSMDRYVEDMIFAIYNILDINEETLDIEPFDVMGYSFGGVLAQAIVAKYPEKVNKVVLLSTTPGLCGQIPSYKAIMMSMTFGKAVFAHLFGTKGSDGDILKNFKAPNPLGPLYSTGALVNWARGKRECNDKHEALVIHGSNDHLLPVKNAIALKTLFSDCWLEVIPGGDHLAPLVYPEYCANVINMFLEH